MNQQQLRDQRKHEEDPTTSNRTPAQRDRDRLLYSSGFRRLANVTQVVAADHGYVFHNRLTHALKVAQIGRRLAEKFKFNSDDSALADRLGGLDPDVVEAAGLAHDLGHPPFGHLAEKVLDDLAKRAGGYEGNAQSFRIVTKLAARAEETPGLNLTRATLNAMLKYPWPREENGFRSKKWGAYESEQADFNWAREPLVGKDSKTLEAEIMDHADDIAYSIYDLEDFYKAGKIPLDRMSSTAGKSSAEIDQFIDRTFARWERDGKKSAATQEECCGVFDALSEFFPKRPFSGTRVERGSLRDMTSFFVTRYVDAIRLNEPKNPFERLVVIENSRKLEMTILKELTWNYVIDDPALVTQQHGYRIAIAGLFDSFLAAIVHNNWAIFPPAVQELISTASPSPQNIRTVADYIATMSESQALALYQRLMGISTGSFFQHIV